MAQSLYPDWRMPAHRLLAENIAALLKDRHQTQKDLADWCRHSQVWLSKFLAGDRGLKLTDLDRIADFFGLVTFQLFQPGISSVTERRTGKDRRSGHDRRIGTNHRVLEQLRAEIERVRPRRQKDRDDKRA